jgi:diacylglycerol kinase family enzyme
MKVMVIINGAAGSVGGKDDQRAGRICDAFRTVNVEAEVRIVKGRQLIDVARDAAQSGVDAVVAGGGDGTISTVARVLAGGSIPLGVLPLGTLNHFAKDAGIPLNFNDAVRVISEGNVRTLDLGEVNSYTFINNSSIGLYPHIVQQREELRQRHGSGKWLAMMLAAISVFRRFPLLRVRIELDYCIIPLTTPFLFVGNNEYQMSLFALGARSKLDGGKLSLYVARCKGRLCLFRLAFLAIMNRLDQAKDFDLRSVTEIWLETRRRKLRVSLDGEVVRLRPPLHYRVLPGALRVILPITKSEP